jgi:hypothetical protein
LGILVPVNGIDVTCALYSNTYRGHIYRIYDDRRAEKQRINMKARLRCKNEKYKRLEGESIQDNIRELKKLSTNQSQHDKKV